MGGTRIWLILPAAILAVGCGGNGDAAGRATATASPTAQATPAATATPAAAPAASRARGVRLQQVGRFDSPVHVLAPPDDTERVMVVEQDGRIRVIRDGEVLTRPFLDIRDLVMGGGEQGLLSLAFAADYTESALVYVYYTDRSGDQRVVEYKAASPDRADPGSARLILRMADDESNHNGGQLAIGPDGLLYIGTGDGGGGGDRHGARGNAQNLGSLLGKILRIEPAPSGGNPYTVPQSNPFVDRDGARGEIYAYGLRNPWRFSFHRSNGALAIGDVGQGEWEEINYVPRDRGKGANFGWRPFEGRARYTPGERAPGHVKPVIVQSHDDGNCSITGGIFVGDRSVSLRGRYVFGDFCKGRIYEAKLSDGKARRVRRTSLRVANLSSFGEDGLGRVYAASLSGPVYRIVSR
jgi:glucose/arabinose dehydrogenase